MRKIFVFCLAVSPLINIGLKAQDQITAYIHANVINVESGRMDADQTIITDHGTITAAGPYRSTRIPAGAALVDCSKKFLMPGLVDAHIHFFQSGGLYTRPDGLNLSGIHPYADDQAWIRDHLNETLARYLACGITTVVDVGGPFSNYAIREKANHDPLSPDAWVTGPLISTYQPPNLDKKDPPIIKVTSPEEARELVRKQLPYHPDFIKIWYIVLPNQSAGSTLPIVKAAIEESHANHLKVAVHATEYETAKLAVEAGADILVHSVDDKALDPELLRTWKQKNIVYIPTLTVMDGYSRTFSQQFAFTAHDYKYGDPFMMGSLMDLQHLDQKKIGFNYRSMRSRYPHFPTADDSMMMGNLKRAQEMDLRIVAGTDAGNIGTLHASSLLTELKTMKASGLSNLQVLQAATIQAARGFGKSDSAGSIRPGKKADFLILDQNPLEDLAALDYIPVVVHRGVKMDTDSLLPESPEMIVQRQVNAYNAHDLGAFMDTYADSVELYQFPGTLLSKGRASMRETYGNMFQRLPGLHAEITGRLIQGNYVIDHERVTGLGKGPIEAVAIYTVEAGKIQRVYFLR